MTATPSAGVSEGLKEQGRSAQKRRAILDAATEVFLQKGYLATNMDEIAALAAVSKQLSIKFSRQRDAVRGDREQRDQSSQRPGTQ